MIIDVNDRKRLELFIYIIFLPTFYHFYPANMTMIVFDILRKQEQQQQVTIVFCALFVKLVV